MALLCGNISRHILASCDRLPSATLDETLYLINRDDIDFDQTVVNAAGEIVDLVLKADAYVFQFDGANNSLVPSVSQNNDGLTPTFTHSLEFKPFVIGQLDRNQVEALTQGRYVGIVDRVGNKALEVFGWDVGVRCETIDWQYGDAASGGVPTATLVTPSNGGQEPRLPRVYDEGTYQATKDAILAEVPILVVDVQLLDANGNPTTVAASIATMEVEVSAPDVTTYDIGVDLNGGATGTITQVSSGATVDGTTISIPASALGTVAAGTIPAPVAIAKDALATAKQAKSVAFAHPAITLT